MPYPKAKIYKQGGHFIAIPHTEQPHKERRKAVETEIFVEDPPDETPKTTVEIAPLSEEESKASEAETSSQVESIETKPQAEMPKPKRGRITTKRKLFDELYKTYYSEKKRTRRKLILQAMLPYFRTADDAAIFVDKRLRQKQENFIARRIRMTRKASLTNFNYFVTVTHFYGHSFSLDNNPPNISLFRQQWVAQRKSEVNGKNCYRKFVDMSKAKVERFQHWLYFLCFIKIW